MKKSVLLALISLFLILHSNPSWSQDLDTHLQDGQENFKAGNLDAAANEFTQAVEILKKAKRYDNARTILGNIGVIRIKQERFDDAISVYEEALELPGKVAPDVLEKFTKLIVFCAEKISDHVVVADSIARLIAAKVKISPEDMAIYLASQGDAYRALGLYAPAVDAYTKALASKGYPKEKRPTLLTALGLAQGSLGRYSEALKNLDTATKEASTVKGSLATVESLSNKGIIYWEMGQLSKALDTLNLAQDKAREFKLRRNEGVDYNNVGAVYKTVGDWQKATASFEKAYEIAKEVSNRRDEAIALNNLALMKRLSGLPEEAMKDYQEALAIYQEVQFLEGVGTVLMGMAAIDKENGDYALALEQLLQAKEIYEAQALPNQKTIVYTQLGLIYQLLALPKSATRDLVFEPEDEPEGEEGATPVIKPNDNQVSASGPGKSRSTEFKPPTEAESLALSEEYFKKAERLAVEFSLAQSHWKALQGLADLAKAQGEFVKAEELYAQAIKVVLSIKTIDNNPEVIQNYLKDKEDLFVNAIEVCALLYNQTKDESLLKKQMEYDEIYRKEIFKANMQLSKPEYDEPNKKALFEKIEQLGAEKQKAADAVVQAKSASTNAKSSKATEAALKAASEVEKVTAAQFEKYLSEWKDKYKDPIFDSDVTLNIEKIRSLIDDNTAIVQYIPLDQFLQILVITKTDTNLVQVEISHNKLYQLILSDFISDNIEKFGHMSRFVQIENKFKKQQFMNKQSIIMYAEVIKVLEAITKVLYTPIQHLIKDKKNIYFITSKSISYVPFAALIAGKNDDNSPIYLIEEKQITLSRFGFFKYDKKKILNKKNQNIIIVSNPKHESLNQPALEGAEKEGENVKKVWDEQNIGNSILLKLADAKESTWLSHIKKDKFNVMYFATHGVPHSESLKMYYAIKEKKDQKIELTKKQRLYSDFFDEHNLTNTSLLNSYLYMSYPDVEHNGMLLLKDILNLDDKIFENADLAVLSACNSAVDFSPQIFETKFVVQPFEDSDVDALDNTNNSKLQNYLEYGIDKFNKSEIEELKKFNWQPGIDQVCLVDTFMNKNFNNVYGNLWFVDDLSSSMILSSFMENYTKGQSPAEALRNAQIAYIKDPQLKVKMIKVSPVPMHPFYWAAGHIFGL
ncbi:MAG: CHAT domain-containing protein [Deltaproteobacteria bacterium]|jgi:tetratricopeptide (TPR) repeat protein|nr:CHAT domain-containing protein [Deltaproteobacteria bacterium]